MDFIKFISEQTLVLVAVIYALGIMLKGVKKIPDWTIPWILLVISIAFSVAIMGFNVQAIIQAVLVVAAAVYSNQLFKQTIKGFKVNPQTEAPKEINPTRQTTNDIK
jgi:hypothetical protein